MDKNFSFGKRLKGVATAAILGTTLLLSACSKKPEGVMATVNDTEITDEQFMMNYASQRNYYALYSGEESLKEPSLDNKNVTVDEQLKTQVLDSLVQMELIRQDAEKMGITVDQAAVDEQMKSLEEAVGGAEALESEFAKMGYTREFYESYMKDMQVMSSYYQKKLEELEPTDEESEEYYNKNKENYFKADASHILVSDAEKANELKKEIKNGADFAKLAKENSEDTGTAEKGGELGEFTNGTMVAEFNDTVKTMKVGDVSDPVKSQFGYHIIKLNSREIRPYSEVSNEVKEQLTQEKMKAHLEKLEKDAKIKKYLDPKEELEIPEKYQIKSGQTQEQTEENVEAPAEGNANAAQNAKNSTNEKNETKNNAEAK